MLVFGTARPSQQSKMTNSVSEVDACSVPLDLLASDGRLTAPPEREIRMPRPTERKVTDFDVGGVDSRIMRG